VIREGLIQRIRQLFVHVWVQKTGIFNIKCWNEMQLECRSIALIPASAWKNL